MATKKASSVSFHLAKNGPAGAPLVEASLVGGGNLEDLSRQLAKTITRDADVLKRMGLKACQSCISGFDIWIRRRFDDVITVEF